MNKYKLGLFAEYFLIFILFIQGYKIIARRYKTKLGEIDLIATKKDNLYIYEVKARTSKMVNSDIVHVAQKKRIENATRIFLAKNNKYLDYNIFYTIFIYKNIFNFKFYI